MIAHGTRTKIKILKIFGCKILYRKLLKQKGIHESLSTAWGLKIQLCQLEIILDMAHVTNYLTLII